MVKQLLFPLLLLASCLLPAAAATARSYGEALRKAGDKDPIVIFCYGANYDATSEACYDEFVKKRKIMGAARNSVFLEMPIYQMPDEKQKKEMDRALGGKRLPGGIWSYPCLAVVDGRGNLRGIVQSAEEMKDAETAGAALAKILKAFDEQQGLLNKAAKATGSRQSKLLVEASDIDLRLPRQLPRAGKDTEGVNERFNFDPIAVMTNLQPMTAEAANAYIRNMMANGSYTRRQRQEMMMAYAGHMRRLKASPERLRALYTEMRNIDPTSMYAAYAEGAVRLWGQSKEGDKVDGNSTGLGDRQRPVFE